MEFEILGPLHVSNGGRVLDPGGGKQRLLLACLLVRANRVVSLDRLIDELWGERPPRDAAAAVHSYVSRLRRALVPDRSAERAGGLVRVSSRGTCCELVTTKWSLPVRASVSG